MKRLIKTVWVLALASGFYLILNGCSPKGRPYADGPVMSQEEIVTTFQPILEFMDVKPGLAFADVGAGSGARTVMMATLMSDATIYVQDIDTTILRQENLDKILDFYGRQSQQDLRKRNNFHLIIGNGYATNLPHGALDVIYSNATMHVLDSPDSMLMDLRKKLNQNGTLFVRDGFKKSQGKAEYCDDSQCKKPLLTEDEFLRIMERNNFQLIKQAADMRGFPIFGFRK